MYLRPRPLARTDVLHDFTCESEEQGTWLREHARQAHGARSAHVMVVTPRGSQRVVAYYAWAMASVKVPLLPERAARGVGRHPQPFALLARLGVDAQHERRGLGHALLADAVQRTVEVGHRIGCRGLLVHAQDASARDFYLHALPGLEPSPTDPLHLIVLMKDLRAAVGNV